ncbi:MAG TPA: response regulator transcription factor [Gammaproteobacteria bacterium]|nr:response regulator transcription factor [Gammaproteobacteria bacterium]
MTASSTASSLPQRDAKPAIVALALRDKTLAATLAQRLAAGLGADVLQFRSSSPAQLVPWLDDARADVLLLDQRWLHRLAGAATRRLGARWPAQRVLLVGDRACRALAEHVVRQRLHGFLLANEAAELCAKAVGVVERGEIWVPRTLLVELLFEHFDSAGEGEAPSDVKLTRRETEVVGYVRRGFANKQIAESLAIRVDTVKKHLRSAYTKLGVHRRSEIMMGAVRLAGT